MLTHELQGPRRHCDVLVIGGGPAGSTVAPLLAQKGHRVVLLEKARHPRFHIGESLLPANLPLFERLGVADEVRAIGVEKWAAEFVSPQHDSTQEFRFAEAWNKSMPHAYQVRRAEFDEILLRNAARLGVEVHEGCQVHGVDFLADDTSVVRARRDDGAEVEWQARFVVDASGRDTFLAHRLHMKRRNPRHNSAAVFAHFTQARRQAGQAEGNITVFWFEHGWFWFIPMRDDITSIGMVTWPHHLRTRGARSLQQFLLDDIASCPALARRLEEARLVTAVQATGNFSYVAERTHGTNYLLLGDAYTFIDPVFSSGVWLAMNGGVLGAEAVDACLKDPTAAPAALRRFDARMKHGPRQFSWFIYRATNPIMRDFFMGPKDLLRMKQALLSLLAGDIFGQTPIWRSVWAFKAFYYIANLLQPRRAFLAWRQRRINIRKFDDSTLYPVP